MATPFAYRRAALAETYCEALQGTGMIDASSGLFLAAPRRTGKSTFLREDLVPAMKARGWETLYVDLWDERERDPAELIIATVRAGLAAHDGPVRKAARKVGLERLTVLGTLSLDLNKIGQEGGATIADALELLRLKSKKPLALLIDEAQHALSSKAGTAAMFSLKAARDRLNQGTKEIGLRLVLTGSNRDKLTHLVTKRSQPFFGAGITKLPLLDRRFVEAYADWLNKQFVNGSKFLVDTLDTAFKLAGNRPELLRQLVADAVTELGGAKALDDLVERHAAQLQRRMWQDFESSYNQLSTTQKAVLDAIARLSPDFEPFSDAALAAYAAILGKEPGNSSIQTALDGLRDKELIWRAGRGDYSFEDDGLRDWYLHWKPKPST